MLSIFRTIQLILGLFSALYACICIAEPPRAEPIDITQPLIGPTVMTLKDAIYLALRFNNNIQSAEFKRVIDKFSLRVAYNAFEFQYALTGNANGSRSKSNGFLAHNQSYNLLGGISVLTPNGGVASATFDNRFDGTYYNPLATLQFTQPLIQGSRQSVVLAPLYNAIDQEYIARIALKNTIISSVVTVINDYNAIVLNENSLKVQKQALVRAQENLLRVQRQINAGVAPPMNLPQAQLSVSQSLLSLTQIQNSLNNSIQQLLIDIGLNPMTKIIVPIEINIKEAKVPDQNTSIEIALKNSPTYQADLLNLKIAKRALLVAKDNYTWTLDATVQATFGGGSGGPPNNNFQSLSNGNNNSQSAGLTLSIPIANYPLKQQIVNARVALQQQIIQTEFDKKNVTTQVINAITNIKAAKQAIVIAIESEKLAEQNLTNTLKQQQYGQTTALAVSQQQDALTSAQQNVVSAQIAYMNSVTNFEQLLQITLDTWGIKIRY